MATEERSGPGKIGRGLTIMTQLKSFFGSHIAWGWKGIAKELGTTQRTAMRWGKRRGLPFRYGPGVLVWAFRIELRLWLFRTSELKAGRHPEKVEEKCQELFNRYAEGHKK